jgi:PAS domain S-box-containing protein
VVRRSDPRHDVSTSVDPACAAGAGAQAEFACAVLLVGSNAAELIDDLLLELVTLRDRSVHRGPIVIWQVEPSDVTVVSPGVDDNSVGAVCRGFRELTDEARLEPGAIYFAPPHLRVWFEGTAVRVAPRSSENHHPIDRLLLSMAEGWGSRCVSVCALPSTADGECGLRIIRAVGGLALLRPALPRAKALPRPVQRVTSTEKGVGAASERTPASSPTGQKYAPRTDLPGEASGQSALRLSRVFSAPARLRVGVVAACEAAVQQARQRGRVRVWMPGCKTGGMTYAVAMQLSEAAARSAHPPKIIIFGTDDDEYALAIARAGRYPTRAALGMEPELRGRYLFDEGDRIRVSEALREICVFSRHELLRDPPMARMDLVVCHRVFEGVPIGRRVELVDGFHYSLRHGGALLALDHIDLFGGDLFTTVGPGFLRARPEGTRSIWPGRFTARPENLRTVLRERSTTSSVPSASASAHAPMQAVLEAVAVPLLVCDAGLRLSLVTREAQLAFALSERDVGTELTALAPRLPGGVSLVDAARRAAIEKTSLELSVRAGRRTYLTRIAPLHDHSEPGVSIVFNDVSEFAAAQALAVAERRRHAKVTRLGELAIGSTSLRMLGAEALATLFGSIAGCSFGIVVELTGEPRQYEVLASRGLGVDPLRTLSGMADAAALLDAVIAGGCLVSQSGDRASLVPVSDSSIAHPSRPYRAQRALATFAAGVACPIMGDGVLLGVLALYGRRSDIDAVDHQDFMQAIANVIGGALVRQRALRRVRIELAVGRLMAGASDLNALGEGLSSAFGDTLAVSSVEIWASRGDVTPDWARLFPIVDVEREGPEGEWPHALELAASARPVSCTSTTEGSELLVPIEVRDLPRHVLRLRGKALRAPDGELARGLKRVAEMLAAFLERLHALELSRQQEASYRQKSAELEALYLTLPVGVSIHDRNGVIRHVNRQLARLEAPSVGAAPDPLERLYAEEMPRWIARVLDSGESIHDVELFVTEAGRTLSWLCNFAPIRDARGTIQGVSAVVQDITPLKSVEATLREADHQKNDFLAILGHELRNPMAALRNATELLGRIEQTTPQIVRLQSIFDRQTLQTTKLIDGLLDVARVARGKLELQLAPVQLVELVRQVVDDRRQQFDRRELELRLPSDELWVTADRMRLVQIFDNLISNALKFTLPNGHILLELRSVEGRARLRVEDDGVGIDAELLPHIFEPFRQGHLTRAQSQGLGLGLALVKGLVELHGFELAVHSAGPGLGASFQIDFPLCAAPESPAPESRVDGRPLDLLLVEDNPDIAETLAEILGVAGHRVEVQGNAEDALGSLRRRRPDAVLCDIGLPGMDGLELATRLRADPALCDIMLVAMTGFSDSATRSRIERVGFDRHLIKPVQLDALRECLERVARGSSRRHSRR